MTKTKTEPVRIGDKFKMSNGSVWEVIGLFPGGKVDLFNREKTRFTRWYCKAVKELERVV